MSIAVSIQQASIDCKYCLFFKMAQLLQIALSIFR